MVKVKKCLNDACSEFILVEDGRLFVQPKESCDIKGISKDFAKQFAEIVPGVSETVYITKKTLRVKEGDDIPI